MPTVVRLASCTIAMYAGDHLPPHFHVRANDGRQALVNINTLAVLSTDITRRELAEALAWAGKHQATLATKWQELNP